MQRSSGSVAALRWSDSACPRPDWGHDGAAWLRNQLLVRVTKAMRDMAALGIAYCLTLLSRSDGGEPGGEANGQKVEWVHRVVDSLLEAMLVRGFHGVGTVRINVQDGTIRFLEDGIERTQH